MATKCIVCGKDRKGTEVADDLVIRSIRRVKLRLNMAQNNKLVVCKDCMGEHLKRRQRFERRLVFYGGIGLAILLVFLLIASNKLMAIVLGLLLLLVMVMFSVISDYHPATARQPDEQEAKGKRKRAKK